MIVTDDQRPDSPQKPQKSDTRPTLRDPSPGGLPSYDDATLSSPTSTSALSPMTTGNPYANYQAIPLPSPPPSLPRPSRNATRRAKRRFFGGLAIALIVYIIIASFLSVHETPVRKTDDKSDQEMEKDRKLPSLPEPAPSDIPGPGPHDGEIIECTTRDSWTSEPSIMAMRVPWKIQEEQVAYTTFSMPLDIPSHYFLTKGSHAAGTFTLEEDDELDGDQLYVHIQASWRHDIALSESRICLLQKPDGSMGLGIYTHQHNGPSDRRYDLHLVLRVQIPAKNAPLHLNSLAAGLSQFEMDVTTTNKVDFKSLVLATSNAAIRSLGTVASKLVFATSNGSILGTYNVTDSITITTSNGLVDVNVNAFNEDTSYPTTVTATTKNAPVKVNASLYYTGEPISATHPLPEDSNGTFKFNLVTSNGPIKVDFKEAPVDSALSLVTTTSNAIVEHYLHPTFEGKITAVIGRNSDFSVKEQEPKPKDPAGRGRRRVIQINRMWGGFISGLIHWSGSDSQKLRGDIVMTTSNGAGRIQL